MHQLSKKLVASFVALAATVAVLVVVLPASAGGLPIQNGSFETCDLTAWSSFTQPGASLGVTGGGNTIDGCQGFVSTGSAAVGAYSWLHHAFYAQAGTRVQVWGHFGSDCNGNNAGGTDDGEFIVDGNSQSVTCDFPFNYGYEAHVFTVGYTGWHDFYAEAANFPDTLFSSTLFVDKLTYLGLTKVT
jgi:hypothetical protein